MKISAIKRAVSLILAMCVAFGMTAMPAFAQQAYSLRLTGSSSGLVPITELVFEETFDSKTTGAALSVGGTLGNSGKTLTITNVPTGSSIAEIQNPNKKAIGKALNVAAVSDSSKLALKSATTITGDYSIEFKFRRNDIAEIPQLLTIGYDNGSSILPAVKLSVNKGTSVTDGGRLYYYNKDNVKTEAIDQRKIVEEGGTRFMHPSTTAGISSTSLKYKDDHIDHYWYSIKVDVNGTNNTYDFYLNGSLCAEDVEFIKHSGHTWNGINMPFVIDTGSCNVDYDDLRIYREPHGTTTLYANDYSKGAGSWTIYAFRGSRNVPGMEGLGLSVFNSRGVKMGYSGSAIKATANTAGQEHGVFVEGLVADDDITIDFDFGVSAASDKYTPIVGIIGYGQPGITYCMDKNKNIYYHYYNGSSYEPVGRQSDDIDGTVTLHVDFKTLTCDLYINGQLIDAGRSVARATAAGHIVQNSQEFLLSFGSRNENGTLGGECTYDNLRISREERENIISDLIATFAANDYIVDGTTAKLPKTLDSYAGYTISWASSNPTAINPATGAITKSVEETPVTLTATVTDSDGKYSRSEKFNVTVAAGGGEIWSDALTGISAGVIGNSIGDRNLWFVNAGSGKIAYNPSNDEDQAAEINAGADVYFSNEARTHDIIADASVYITDGSDAQVYLADENGKKLANIIFDNFRIKSNDIVIADKNYPEESWVDVRILASTLKRTYDVYIDGNKINPAPINFVDAAAKNSVSRFGFAGNRGKFYVDNLSLSGADFKEGVTLLTPEQLFRVDNLIFKDKDGNTANEPQSEGTIQSATVSVIDAKEGAALLVAAYTKEGKLCDIGYKTLNLSNGLNTASFAEGIKFPKGEGSYKVMLWDNMTGLTPVIKATDKIEHTPTMYIVGDRSAADYSIASSNSGWGSAMKALYASQNMDVINLATDGQNITKTANGDTHTILQKVLMKDDILVISSGYDDYAANISETDYNAALKSLSQTAARNGASCVYVTSPYDTAAVYNTQMKNAAAENGASVVELTNEFVSSNGYFDKQGAQYAAQQVANKVKAVNAYFAANASTISNPAYTKSGAVLKVSGTGAMPVYSAFTETPWKAETGITSVEIAEGITNISENAFNGFSLTSVYIPESVEYIANNAFKAGTVIYGVANSAAQKYAEANGYTFYLKKLRVACVGNSHTDDWTSFSQSIIQDLYDAGLQTEIQLDIIINGGFYMYKRNHQKEGDWATHYIVAQKPGAHYYSSYNNLNTKSYDLVLIQDYRESDSATSAQDFTKGMAAVMRWLRDIHPNAKVAWVADWSHECYIEQVNAAALTKYNSNTAPMMNAVMGMTSDAPDFVVPMGTAVQNARSSYLGSVANRLESFISFGTTDYAGGKDTDTNNLTMFPLLHRDQTHSSFELGRYLVGATVLGKVFNEYKGVLAGAGNINYFNALKTMPDCSVAGLGKEGNWRGHFNDNIWSIVKESASNALNTPTAVTRSAYTTDPADAVEAQISALDVSGKSAQQIVSLVKAINSDIEIETSDVQIGDTVKITFVYGYTMKTVTIG